MDDLVEVEIKIEYNESLEKDPLCDKNIYSESNTEAGTRIPPDESKPKQTCQMMVTPGATKENCYDNNSSLNVLLSYPDNVTRGEETWYDLMDNFGKFLCKYCNLKYSTLQTLRFHVKTKHPEQASNIKENFLKCKRNSKLKCHICKQRFKEILELKNHVLNSHSLEDINKSCLYCGAVFSTENEMSAHLLMLHKKIIHRTTHMCNICGYRTSTKSHYNQHKNTHKGDKNKKCQYCDYATNYLSNLKIHERIHTQEKVYVCDFKNCNYQCSAKSALWSHQLKHNPEDYVLYCDKCSYKTIYRQCLKRHDDCHRRNSMKLKS